MSRFVASLLRLGLMALATIFTISAIALPTSDSNSWTEVIKTFRNKELWNKLSEKDKKKLRKFVSPSVWADWIDSMGSDDYHYEEYEDNGVGRSIAKTAKNLGRTVGNMAHNAKERIPEVGHKVADKTQEMWHGLKKKSWSRRKHL